MKSSHVPVNASLLVSPREVSLTKNDRLENAPNEVFCAGVLSGILATSSKCKTHLDLRFAVFFTQSLKIIQHTC